MSVELGSSSVGCSSLDVGSSIGSSVSLGIESVGSSFSSPVPDAFSNAFSSNLIPESFVSEPSIGEIIMPDNFQNTFDDILNPDIAEISQAEIFDPPSYSEQIHSSFTDNLESVLEPINIVDLPIVELQSSDIEQIINQSEPKIGQIEAKAFVIPSEVEQLVEEVQEVVNLNVDQIVDEPALVEAVSELEKLTEIPVSPEVISSEQLAVPEVVQIIRTNPEIIPETIQATKTLQAFLTAGIEEAQAMELVENALMQTGTKVEVAKQIMVLVQTKQQLKTEPQVKSEVKPAQAEAKVSAQAIKVNQEIEKKNMEDEEEKKKKRRFKFIKDKIALAHIFNAWKKAIEGAPINKEAGEDVIDSVDALALMPTEIQDSGVKSGILPKYVLEWLNFGDGAYRTALSMAKDIGLRSRQAVLEKVFALHQKYYPVTVAEDGEEAAKSNVELVLTYKPNPIGNSRSLL